MPTAQRDRVAERLGTWRCQVPDCREKGTELTPEAALTAWQRHYRQDHQS